MRTTHKLLAVTVLILVALALITNEGSTGEKDGSVHLRGIAGNTIFATISDSVGIEDNEDGRIYDVSEISESSNSKTPYTVEIESRGTGSGFSFSYNGLTSDKNGMIRNLVIPGDEPTNRKGRLRIHFPAAGKRKPASAVKSTITMTLRAM